MSKKIYDINYLLVELEKFKDELKIIENNFKDFDSQIDYKLNKQNADIITLNNELNNYKEVINATKEYILLELESSLDKHNQIQIKSRTKYEDLLAFIKNDNNDKISVLSEELGRTKQILDEKNIFIDELKNNNENLENQIKSLNKNIDEMDSLKKLEFEKFIEEKDEEINKIISEKDKRISLLSEEIDAITLKKDDEIKNIVKNNENVVKSITEDFDKFKSHAFEKENEYDVLIEENNILKRSIDVKDEQIKSLQDEILILNSIIKEKDETLDLLNGDD